VTASIQEPYYFITFILFFSGKLKNSQEQTCISCSGESWDTKQATTFTTLSCGKEANYRNTFSEKGWLSRGCRGSMLNLKLRTFLLHQRTTPKSDRQAVISVNIGYIDRSKPVSAGQCAIDLNTRGGKPEFSLRRVAQQLPV